MNTTLHYIYDPMCGWCYAAAPLIQAARQIDGLNIELHAGGLWVGSQIKRITPELRAFVMTNDARIAQISGQTFGAGYQNGLLSNTQAVLDSEPPIRAILAAQQLAGQNAETDSANHSAKGLDLLHAIQTAHFIDGREVSQLNTLLDIATELGWDRDAFQQSYLQTDVTAHWQQTHQLMNQWQIQGYPNFLLQHAGQWFRVPHSAFYGQPEAFAQQLRSGIASA